MLLPLYAEIGRLFWERVFAGIPPVIGERLGFAVGLLVLAGVMGGVQRFCVLAIFPLLLLGNERGKWKMKHFFYIYYPAHLAVIGAQCSWRSKPRQDNRSNSGSTAEIVV